MRFDQLRRHGALLLGVLGALSCGDSSGPGTGRLTLLLKDAACGMTSAWVTISQINLQGAGGTIVLRDDPVSVDLLTLKDQVLGLIKDYEIPAGTYHQLRFVIPDAYIELENGDIYASTNPPSTIPGAPTGSLQMPSYEQSGLKVILPGNAITIPEGGDVAFMVDFDVCQSFGPKAGGSGQWVMHPVIKATGTTLTGSIHVTLTPAQGLSLPTDAVFTATITPAGGGDPVSKDLIDSDSDGVLDTSFNFLFPGDYSVDIIQTGGTPVDNATYAPTPPQSVTAPSGGTVTAAFTIDVGVAT